MKVAARRLALIGLLSALAVGTTLADAAYYIVFEVQESGSAEPVFARVVDLPVETVSDGDFEDARLRALAGAPLRALQTAIPGGEVVHRAIVEIPRWIRGEFHGAALEGGGSAIEGYRFPDGRGAFVARVPAVPGARLTVDGPTREVFDLDRLLAGAGSLRLAPLAAAPTAATAVSGGGTPPNRMDLLIMGDGYTSAQQAVFDADAADLENDFLGIEPLARYRSFLNVTALFTPSAQSGADHPPYNASCSGDDPACCSDSTMQGDPLAGTFVDTALGARYCAFQIHRLLVVSSSAVLAAASAVPTWDQILVLVNDTTYGGSGGFIGVTSTHPSAVDIARHEYGHSFTDLADEYESAFPGYPPCSDVTSPACEANVTNETAPASIKWAPWILPATPIPTPETGTYNGVVGLFQGARYLSSGMYRPRNNCLMRSLGVPFGEVCSQEYVRVLYGGGWGSPVGGVDPIEPGSEVPAIGPPVDGSGGVTFSVGLLQPIGPPALDVRWYVDNVLQPGAGGSTSFAYTPPGAGTYQVEVQVEDLTPLVHPSMAAGQLTSSRSWTVQVSNGPPGRIVSSMTMTRSQLTPGNLVFDWSPSCSPGAVDYAIVEGILGNYYSHKLLDCTDEGTPLTEEVTPAIANAYYMVVPLNGVEEGSHGTDSQGVERPRVGPVCYPVQTITACP